MSKQPKAYCYVDQHGRAIWARTVRELRERVGGGRVAKMYRDSPGGSLHVGYVVGQRWFDKLAPVEVPA